MSWGWDDNVREATESAGRLSDRFLRLLLDASAAPLATRSYACRVGLLAMTERYNRYGSDSRQQIEGTIDLERRIGYAGSLWINGRAEDRVYPDSTLRNFRRQSFAVGTNLPLRGGRLSLSTGMRGLDFRQTSRFDRLAQAFSASYRIPAGARFDLSGAFEFEWAHWGRPAIKWGALDVPVEVGDQKDLSRTAQAGVRYLNRWLLEMTLGWTYVRSNSIGYTVSRKSAEGGVTGWLPGEVLLQIRGRAESVTYGDSGLNRIFLVVQPGEVEANDANNDLLLRMRRRILPNFALEARTSWFRNESLFVGLQYRKMLTTLGVVWSPAGASDF